MWITSHVCWEGGCGTQNSIGPDSALIHIGTPERPYVDHQSCVLGGRMRN
ncbi:MAG: hypothetical protein K2H45_11385 [Acetatifactor sp.]|nr:hypothetical protein [Acetatifactor sp.]